VGLLEQAGLPVQHLAERDGFAFEIGHERRAAHPVITHHAPHGKRIH
jgi:hypothetical protein